MSLTWWEKTVEYSFIIYAHKRKYNFLAPLDGNHESAGDLLVKFDGKWIAIEFKRYRTSFEKEELEKFGGEQGYLKAKSVANGFDNHHSVVFGHVDENHPANMVLGAFGYFDTNPRSIDQVLQGGIDQDIFYDYLKWLTSLKTGKNNNSGDGFSKSDFSTVIGVPNDTSKPCISLGMNNFLQSLDLYHSRASDFDREMEM